MALRLKETGNDSRGVNELNLLGEGTFLEGKIKSKGSIRIDGKLKGSIVTADVLTIGSKGFVSGEVEAREAILGGKIEGNIKAIEKLVLEPNSILIGNIETKKLIIDEGAIFQGKANMGLTASNSDNKSPANQDKKGETVEKSSTG